MSLEFGVLDDSGHGSLEGGGVCLVGDADGFGAEPDEERLSLDDAEHLVVVGERVGQGEFLGPEVDCHDAVYGGVHRAVQQVDPRCADEGGDEGVGGQGVEVAGVSTCWRIPSRMTATRSPSAIASAWSWVT